MRTLQVQELGRIGYERGLRLQHELVARRADGQIEDRLLLLEHEPVVTVGRKAKPEVAASVPFPVFEVERGGEATWHGPGQLVGYPILYLEPGERDLHRYLRNLEEVLVRTVKDLGLAATRSPPHTGVWVDGRKVASIGVAVRRWVTYHGFALNVCPDLGSFASFQPCGLSPRVMTSLERLLGAPLDEAALKARLLVHFESVFERRAEMLGFDGAACMAKEQSPGDRVFEL